MNSNDYVIKHVISSKQHFSIAPLWLSETILEHEAIQVQTNFFVTIYAKACQLFGLLHCGYETLYYNLSAKKLICNFIRTLVKYFNVAVVVIRLYTTT